MGSVSSLERGLNARIATARGEVEELKGKLEVAEQMLAILEGLKTDAAEKKTRAPRKAKAPAATAPAATEQ